MVGYYFSVVPRHGFGDSNFSEKKHMVSNGGKVFRRTSLAILVGSLFVPFAPAMAQEIINPNTVTGYANAVTPSPTPIINYNTGANGTFTYNAATLTWNSVPAGWTSAGPGTFTAGAATGRAGAFEHSSQPGHQQRATRCAGRPAAGARGPVPASLLAAGHG